MRLYRRGGARRTRRLVEERKEQRPCPQNAPRSVQGGVGPLGAPREAGTGKGAEAAGGAGEAESPQRRAHRPHGSQKWGGRCGLPRRAPNGRDPPAGSPNEAGLTFECYLIVSDALLIKGCTKSESTTRAGQSPAPCGHQGEPSCAAPDDDGAASSTRGRAHPTRCPPIRGREVDCVRRRKE